MSQARFLFRVTLRRHDLAAEIWQLHLVEGGASICNRNRIMTGVRMIEDMAARKLNPHTQRSHIYSCKRFAAWLKRSPDTATADEVRLFQPPAAPTHCARKFQSQPGG